MDYSKFKKISSDGKTTTLRHEGGHELRIAHSGLTSKMKAELDKLPGKKMANGGSVKMYAEGTTEGGVSDQNESSSSSQNSQAPVTINIGQPSQPQMPVQGNSPQGVPNSLLPSPGMAPPPDPAAQMQATQEENPVQTNTQPPQAPEALPQSTAPVSPSPMDANGIESAQASGASPVDVNGMSTAAGVAPAQPMSFDDHKQTAKSDLDGQAVAWAQDLANGHITPKTYSDLFAEKSTLGKISTIFGLILGGFGGGLTHSPNAAAEMLDKVIDNDLNAQKQSKTNAQNFLKLNQERLMNEANVAQKVKEGVLTEAQAKNMNAEANTKAFALAQSQMLLSSYHNQVMQVDKMPEGPQKEQAKQVLGLMYSKIGEKINNVNDQAAGASAYMGVLGLGGQQQTGQPNEQQFQNKTSGMRMLGEPGEKRAKDLESKHFPGLKGQASVPLGTDDRDALNSGIEFDQKLHRFMDWTSKHSGDLSPSDKNAGQALAAELQGAYRQATHGGVYKEGEQNFISKLIDSDPTKFFNSIRVMPQLQAIAGENQARVNQKAKSLGFSGYSSSGNSNQNTPNPKEGDSGQSKSGKPIVYKNGAWKYK